MYVCIYVSVFVLCIYICIYVCMYVCGDVCVCECIYIDTRGRKETGSAKVRARKTRSAIAKARNLMPKKERESASVKGFHRECESTGVKNLKSACPAALPTT